MLGIWIFALGLLVVPAFSEFVPFYGLFAAVATFSLLARVVHPSLRYGAYFAFGFLINSWQVYSLCEAQLAHEFDGTRQKITFTVRDMPQQRELATVFLADVEAVHCSAQPCPELGGKRLRLSWYRPPHNIKAGQVWSAVVKLRRPRGLANPGGFDYHAWLLSQNIAARGYVHSEAQLDGQHFAWAQVRAKLSARIVKAAGDVNFSRFWQALLVADRTAISPADWHTLQATGTIHLMAISGLHIGLASLWAFWIGRGLARCWSITARRGAALVMHLVPPLLSCLFALFYAALAGFSIPTVRACAACLMINACAMLGLRISALTLLGCGVAVVAFSEPLAWQNNGFWLSFAAVYLLVHSFAGRLQRRPLRDSIAMQLLLSVGLSVPLLWLGQGVSWVSPLANLIAVPLVSFVVVPVLFIAALCSSITIELAHPLLQGLDWVFGYLWRYLQWLQTAPSALLWSPRPLMPAALALAAIGIVLLLMPRGIGLRGLGAVAVALAMVLRPPEPPPLSLTVLDVGQGLSVVVRTPQSAWLYDTGPAFSSNFDTGSRIIAPYLRAQGIDDVHLIISHADNDHSGGTRGLLSQRRGASLLVGEPLPLAQDAPAQQLCEQGQSWQDQILAVEVLWPPQAGLYEGNAASCVVLVTLPLYAAEAVDQTAVAPQQTIRILLTGDIDKPIERQLLAQLPSPVDVLIAPHHGSKSSSSAEFIAALKPKHVVFSAAFGNRYGHPNDEVVARYRRCGAQLYTTATSGALLFEWQQGKERVTQTRLNEAKLWYR